MRLSFLFAFVCLTLAFGCSKKTSPSNCEATVSGVVKTVAYDEVVDLAPGETAQVGKSQAAITFVGVDSDSRCPRGVSCISEGEAFVIVSRGSAYANEKVRIDVDTKKRSRLTTVGATIEIMDLSPYPEARVKIDPAQRRLRVRFKKSAKM
ncbi:hypothetical protein FUA23_08560 [Neolewinella aurantiaca]|uniref:Lipoprotein n=1 Tax=Neolewinella aurantiaca TaxID=2602767 RepID=A0A5C7FUK1_9BACT|nr:hypothetical protein [Neolewinella aurantiaca]TXF89994.1 hypothetical protein FUA23_08560 [Neolewinella aurantiaca]